MDKREKNSTAISLVLHILILWAAFSLHSAHILIPSRANGMEVSLVSPAELNVDSKIVTHEEYHTVTPHADINFKKPLKPVEKKPLPVVEKPKRIAKVTKAHKKVSNNELTDMLNDLTPAKNQGQSKSSAIGGSNTGTSDSNNLNSNYADLVIAAVRPFVILPDNLNANSIAIIEVTLLPNMHVYRVKLLKSSGNNDYDNNIEEAIKRVPVFPPLPDGAKFTDYRKLRLTFRPE